MLYQSSTEILNFMHDFCFRAMNDNVFFQRILWCFFLYFLLTLNKCPLSGSCWIGCDCVCSAIFGMLITLMLFSSKSTAFSRGCAMRELHNRIWRCKKCMNLCWLRSTWRQSGWKINKTNIKNLNVKLRTEKSCLHLNGNWAKGLHSLVKLIVQGYIKNKTSSSHRQ